MIVFIIALAFLSWIGFWDLLQFVVPEKAKPAIGFVGLMAPLIIVITLIEWIRVF